MNVGAIGALGGLMAATSIYDRVNPVNRPSDEVQKSGSQNNRDTAAREAQEYQRIRFDRVEFDASAVQGTQQSAKAEPEQNLFTATAEEEKPDFRAIKLIKESEIPLPELPDLREKAVINADKIREEVFAELREQDNDSIEINQQLGMQNADVRDTVNPIADRQNETVQNDASALTNITRVEEASGGIAAASPMENNAASRTAEVQDAAERRDLSAPQIALGQRNGEVGAFRSAGALNMTQKFDEMEAIRTSSYATEDIAEKTAGQRLTPAQQEGVETYQHIQSYADAMHLSYARTAV